MDYGQLLDDYPSAQSSSLKAEVDVVAVKVLSERLVESKLAHRPRGKRHEKAVDHIDVLGCPARTLDAPGPGEGRSPYPAEALRFPPREAPDPQRAHDPHHRHVRLGDPAP